MAHLPWVLLLCAGGVLIGVLMTLQLHASLFSKVRGLDCGLLRSYDGLPPSALSASSSQSCCDLASNQSFGFFDDLTDAQWKRAQQIARSTFPNHFAANAPTRYSSTIGDRGKEPIRKSNWWNAENFQEEFHCMHARRLPSDSNGDGPKWVCDPHRIAPSKTATAGAESTDEEKDCLIYSIGSNGNVQFEKAIYDEISPDCEVHTFDMVGYNKRNGNFSQALERYAVFHQFGLGTADQAARNPETFKTLQQTIAELGHVNRTIDVFKIDCEWCEWHTYKDWINSGADIRQILVETHNAPMPEAQHFFYDLHDAGYVIFSKEANYQNGAACVEFGFLKLHTDFFINGSMYNKLS